MQSRVKVFKGSVNQVESLINEWVEDVNAKIINVSMTYDANGIISGGVFVIVAYEITM